MNANPQIWKILLIEDDEEDYLLTREMLAVTRGRKVDLTWVASFSAGQQALFGEEGWDAVLLDYDLGQGTGIDLIRESVRRGCAYPLILLTGRGSYDVDVEAMEAGASLYLTKSEVNPLLLERSIRYAIERKQVDTALRESEERYRLAARATNDAIWDWNLLTDEIHWNDAVRDVFGYADALEKNSGKWWKSRVHPQDRSRVVAGLNAVIQGQDEYWSAEYRFRLADGSYADIFDHGTVVRGETGRAVRMVGAMEDVSQERAAQRRVREGEARFQRLVEVMPAAVYTSGPSGEINYYNQHAAELWGRTLPAGAARLPKDLIPMAAEARAGKSVRGGEATLEHGLTVSVNIDPLYNERGQLAGSIHVLQDITAQKQIEKELIEGKQELEVALARLQHIISSEVVGIIIQDEDGRILEANDTFLRLLGRSRPEMDAGQLYWDQVTPPEYHERDAQAAAQALEQGRSAPYEKETIRADGSRAWLLVSLSHMPGEPGRLVAFILDVSHQKLASQALQESEARYSQLFNNYHTPMLLIDPETSRIVSANPAACAFYGWSLAELTQKTILEINTLSTEEVRQEMRRAREASKGSQIFFFCHRLASGEEREVEVHSGPIQVGQKSFLFSIVLDITERGQVEKARQAALQLNAEILESISDTFYSVDSGWRLTYVNRQTEALWGKDRAQLLGNRLWDLFPYALGSESAGHLQKAMSERVAVHYEAVSPVIQEWVEVHAYPTGDGGLAVYFREIQERKRAEQELRETLDLNEKIISSSQLGILAYRAAGDCVLANEAAARLVGAAREDLLAQNYHEIASWKVSGLLQLAQAVLETGQPYSGNFHFVTTFGREVWWQCAFNCFSSGGETHLLLVFNDVTEAKQLEESLRNSEQRHRETAEALEVDRSQLAAALEQLPMGVGIGDLRGETLFLNSVGLQLHGFASLTEMYTQLEDYLPVFKLSLLDGQLLPQNEWPVARAMRGEYVQGLELCLRNLGKGTECPVAYSVIPVRSGQGEILFFVYIIQDLSEEKRALEELEASRAQLEAVLDNLAEGLVISDPAGRVLVMNPAAVKMNGFESLEEARQKLSHFSSTFEVFNLDGSSLEITEWPLARVARGDTFTGYEVLVRRKDTGVSWTGSFSGNPILNPAGERTLGVSTMRDITQQKRIEQALREGNQRFAALFRAAPVALVMNDLDTGVYLEVNQAFIDLTGFSMEEISNPAQLLRPPPDPVYQPRNIVEILQKSFFQRGETRFVTKDGQTRTGLFSSVRFSLGGREVVLSGVTDVTDLKQAEQTARASEEKFHTLTDHMAQLAWMADENGRFFWYNQRWTEYTGSSAVEMERQGWDSFLHPDYAVPVVEKLQRCFRAGQIWEDTFPLRGQDDQYRWFLSRAVPILDGQGRTARWLGTSTDVTEQLEAERALKESENRFRQLADSMPQLVWMARPDGTVEYYNRRYKEYGGIEPPAQGDAWNWGPVLHPDDLDPTQHAWTNAVRTGAMYQIEHRVRTSSGAYRWHLSRGVPVRNLDGEVIQWYGTATDIHQTRQAQEALHSRQAELERLVADVNRSNRELEEFAYVASHDLQEPLRKVRAFANQLASDHAKQLDEEGHDYLRRMTEAAGRMQAMIDSLLTYSRIATRGSDFVDVDLNKVAEEVISDLEIRLRETGGQVQVQPLPTIRADPLQMRQLLLNLIGNGLKFHRPGVAPQVVVRSETTRKTKKNDRQVILIVEDNGIGFEPGHAERIFQPFQRLHGRSQYEGSGIGLAICRKIAERHGGSVTAQSIPGQGSRFIITLPV